MNPNTKTINYNKWILVNLRNHAEIVLKKRMLINGVKFEADHPFIVRMSWNSKKKNCSQWLTSRKNEISNG